MRTRATVLGHPLHGMLIPFPIGALTLTAVFDALYVWQGDPAWFRAATVANVVGALALLVAIVPGLIDYWSSVPGEGEVRKHASVHMTLGLAVTGYFLLLGLAHWFARPAPGPVAGWSAFAGSLVGVVLLMFQGYLGGGLVTTHQLGVETGYLQEVPPPGREERGAREGGGAP